VIGKQVGNFRLNLSVGEDNLGVLYLGQHVAAGFPVMLRHFAAQFSDVQAIARYLEIARHASSLSHAGIWNVRESVWSGRNAFVVGEPVPSGQTLDHILAREGRLWPELTVKLGWQLASAIATAHAASIYHCRLDGDSIYCFPDESAPGQHRAKIMDFGVAALLDAGTPDWRSPRVEAFGLPFYMAPEQCRAGMVDYRSDVYGLGCVLYHMAIGEPPFRARTPQEIAAAHQNVAPQPITSFDPSLPVELDALVQRMLIKDPGGRPPMGEVAFELERIARQYWASPTVERTVQIDLRVGEPPPPPPMIAEPPRKRRSPVLPALLIGSLAAAGVTVALTRPWQKDVAAQGETSAKPAAAVEPAQPAEEDPPQAPPRPPPMPSYVPPPETELDKQLAAGRAALEEGRFQDAAAALKAARKLEARSPAVETLARQVKVGPQHRRLFDDFMKAADERDPAKARKRLARIPEDSLYRERAVKAFAQVKKDFLHVKLAEARALAETHTCARIPAVEKQVAALFPDSAAEIAAIGQTCTK
jgi:eukaryotic-like serine/threonine-protein kinase